jgi:quercetin dioxygenase-like cupin family protein
MDADQPSTSDRPAALRRGRLLEAGSAPPVGERSEVLARFSNVEVRQILSGALTGPVGYRQDEDEWVVVLAGGAVLEAAGERLHLSAGDWLLIPAGLEHRLVETRPETVWLAVHAPGERSLQARGSVA